MTRYRLYGLVLVVVVGWLTLPWTLGLSRRIAFEQAGDVKSDYYVLCQDGSCHAIPSQLVQLIARQSYMVPIRLRPGSHTVALQACILHPTIKDACSPPAQLVVDELPHWTWRGWR